jgi:DNA-binding NarL/FixJ family response regulator
MSIHQVKTLLVSKPGRMCHIVEALLKTNPQLCLLESIEQNHLTLNYINTHQPELVIYIYNMVDDPHALLGQLGQQLPQIKFVVLASGVQHCPKNTTLSNLVFLKNGSTSAILSAVNQVIQTKQEEVRH